MSDYLNDLVTKTIGTADIIQPRRPARFEPAQTINARAEFEPSSPTDFFEEEHIIESIPSARPHRRREARFNEKSEETSSLMNADEQIEQAPHVKSPETYSLKTENSDARVMLTPKLIASSPELKVESSTVSNLSPPPFTAPLTPPKSFEEKQISNNPTELVPVQTQLAPLAETNNLKISTAKTSTSQTIETRDRIVIEPRVEKIENRVENKSIQQTIIPATQKQQISKQISEYAETTETPTINVTIGRVEIRAAVSSTPPKPISAKPPTLSLDEYLNKRHNGGER